MTGNLILQGYFMGAWMYVGIVFTLPLGLGVYALALDLPVSNNEALEGLVMPASAYVLLGKGGNHLSILKLIHIGIHACPHLSQTRPL